MIVAEYGNTIITKYTIDHHGLQYTEHRRILYYAVYVCIMRYHCEVNCSSQMTVRPRGHSYDVPRVVYDWTKRFPLFCSFCVSRNRCFVIFVSSRVCFGNCLLSTYCVITAL